MKKDTLILAIESSCDDTSAAVIKNSAILSNLIAQQKIHEAYGGVVPELASRAHQQSIVPVVDQALKEAGVELEDIDAIAFTSGPGLSGSLLVGTSFAKALALSNSKPLIDVNHMIGHVLAHFIDGQYEQKPSFPFLCLTVSGGHTQIVLVEDFLKLKVIGSTIDDAAGEAFDKAAKLLNFPYPGGPYVDRNAKEGNENKFQFAKPKMQGYDFSFSGLKTSILYFLQKELKNNPQIIEDNLADLCASIQKTIIDILFDKLIKAADDLKIQQVAIAGGVSANSGLRQRLNELAKDKQWDVFIPKFEYCTDNAAMIAITAYYMYQQNRFADQKVVANPRLKIGF